MSASSAVLVGVTFTWLGMVLAISFVEAPVKFRAPGVTLQIGLGIGRLVFRVLNSIELFLAAAVLIAMIAGTPPDRVPVLAATVAIATLLVQLVAVRPQLTKRSDAVLRGASVPRSHAHYAYIALELVKVAALALAGISGLSAA